MSTIGRSNRRRSGRSRELFKIVAAGSAGLVLMGAAYQSSFAAGNGGGAGAQQNGNVYEEPDDDDGGVSGGVVAGAAVAGAAGIAAGLGAFGGGLGAAGAAGAVGALGAGQFLAGAEHECKERYSELPAGHRVSSLRLFPEQTSIGPGVCQCFHLEARSAQDGNWYSVTHKPEASIFVADASIAGGNLVKQEGSKNIFCVPLGVPQTANGLSVAVLGTYSPAGQPTLTAESRVTIRVTNAGGYFGPDVQ